MIQTKARKDQSRLIRMYFRVDPEIRKRFKAVANLRGETMEERIAYLLESDIKLHLPEQGAKA